MHSACALGWLQWQDCKISGKSYPTNLNARALEHASTNIQQARIECGGHRPVALLLFHGGSGAGFIGFNRPAGSRKSNMK